MGEVKNMTEIRYCKDGKDGFSLHVIFSGYSPEAFLIGNSLDHLLSRFQYINLPDGGYFNTRTI
jgi:hypothetical protein